MTGDAERVLQRLQRIQAQRERGESLSAEDAQFVGELYKAMMPHLREMAERMGNALLEASASMRLLAEDPAFRNIARHAETMNRLRDHRDPDDREE